MTLAPAGLPPDPFRKTSAPADDDVVDLGRYVALFWSYRAAIAACALALAILFAAASLLVPRRYEAETSIVLTQSKLSDRPDAVVAATIQPLLESRSTAAAVIRELGLDKPPHDISATQFFETVVTIEPVRNSTVFIIRAVLDDPALAARVANRVAERAIEMSRRMSQQEAIRSRDDLQQQRDDAKRRMEAAGDALRRFREQSQVELLRKDVDAMLGQRGDLLNLLVQIESEKAKVARAEQDLAARQRIGTIRRTIVDSDPAMVEAARRSTSDANLLGLESRNEFVDNVYQKIDEELTTSRATLAALERKKTQLVDVRKLDGAQLAGLTRLYDVENSLADLQTEHELATTVYKQVATAFETARVQVASRSAQLDILDAAMPSDRPMSRHPARNAAIGLALGAVLAALGAAIHSSTMFGRAAHRA